MSEKDIKGYKGKKCTCKFKEETFTGKITETYATFFVLASENEYRTIDYADVKELRIILLDNGKKV